MFHPSDHPVEMSEQEFRLLRDFIQETFGLRFDDAQRSSLRGRLAGRLSSLDLDCFEDYYRYLRFGPGRREELQRMVGHLTNNETYFFREAAQLQLLAEKVLPALSDSKSAAGNRRLRILSAGCSTGEEAYTLAMLLSDSSRFPRGWDVQVAGVDVDRGALEKARRGVYFHNSFRNVSQGSLARHLEAEGNGVRVKDALRRMVSFQEGNLLDPSSCAELAPLDVVFCRNVLIYFSEAAMRKVVGLIHQALSPGGYLFLGHAESLSRITDRFTAVRLPGAMAYQKAAAVLRRAEAP